MYSDKFKEDPSIFIVNDITAEKLSEAIIIGSFPYVPKVTLHSSLKTANCNSYEKANEIFAAADCAKDDPELLAWIAIKKLDVLLKGQTNVDYYQKVTNYSGEVKVIIRGELKHRAISRLMENKQLCLMTNRYISAGTVNVQENLSNKIISNTLKQKYAVALKNSNTSKSDLQA
ncbi:hypothetical protein EON71_01015 [bacterium]|nr:MAG: hypothetical protein EON71_01015 [bacterium]